jgi:hypothetical protein
MDRIVQLGRELVRIITDPYRPELHYMRGPGPKWHAKHQWASVECHLSGFDPARVQVTQRISYDGLNAASP